MRTLVLGDVGPDVAEVNGMLGTLAASGGTAGSRVFTDGTERAVRAFQQGRGLKVDGRLGPSTLRALRGAMHRLGSRALRYRLRAPMHGDDVLTLQWQLNDLGYDAGREDGDFGVRTRHAVRMFQRDMGLTVDEVCGDTTVRTLYRLVARPGRGGRPVLLRTQEHLRRAGPRLHGKRIVIDPGHGNPDHGAAAGRTTEAAVTWDMARRLEGRMIALGVDAMLSRGPANDPTETTRARFANETGADLLLSLHCDHSPSPHAGGIATFFFGTGGGKMSEAGALLADLVQRELVARTGLPDCGTHPKAWDVLARSRCPAVRVDVGYLSNPRDRALLDDPGFRDVVAEGLLVAVKRLYVVNQRAQPATGTFSFDDVLRQEMA